MAKIQVDPHHAQELLDNIKLEHLAKNNCRHCYGRGYTGFIRAKGQVVLCKCVRKNSVEVQRVVREYNAQLTATVEPPKPTFLQRLVDAFNRFLPGHGKPADSLGI